MDLLNPERTVEEVMRTDFRSCNASTPIGEVATALRESKGWILPVTRTQVPIGVVTERSLAKALAERGGDLSGGSAEDVMEREAPTIRMSAPAREALERIGDRGFLLAVNGEGMLKGVVTLEEFGPHLTEGGLTRLVMRLQRVGAAPPPEEEARAEDEAAEIKSSKSQRQPHPWDSPTHEQPAPVPLVSPSDLVNPLLKARDVMTAEVRSCSPESSVLEAAVIFRDAGCGFVPVVEDGKLVGVLTDRDAILALPDREFELARTPVGEIMSRDLATVEPEATLETVLERLGEAGVRRLLVVDSKGHLAGVVSWADLASHVSERGLGHLVSRVVENR